MDEKAYLILENKMVFEGKSFGAVGETVGEIVFTTALTGHWDLITDPSYYGQIVVQTFPQIDEKEDIPEELRNKPSFLKAYIVHDLYQKNASAKDSNPLDCYFKEKGIIGLYGVNTQELTKILRNNGVMNAKIMPVLSISDTLMEELKNYTIVDAVNAVSIKNKQVFKTDNKKYTVVLWNFGTKENIIQALLTKNCEVIVVPPKTTADEIINMHPDGIVLTNGPGDPADNVDIIAQIKLLTHSDIPIFGICLGHEMLAISQGAKTRKLKYGHHGASQMIKNATGDQMLITSQNHGYTVVPESLPENAKISYVNVDDGSCEGIEYTNFPAFSVQFLPEDEKSSRETQFLFDDFITLMDKYKK